MRFCKGGGLSVAFAFVLVLLVIDPGATRPRLILNGLQGLTKACYLSISAVFGCFGMVGADRALFIVLVLISCLSLRLLISALSIAACKVSTTDSSSLFFSIGFHAFIKSRIFCSLFIKLF